MRYSVGRSLILLDFLQENYPETSKTTFRNWLKHRAVRVNNRMEQRSTYVLQVGDVVEIDTSQKTKKDTPKPKFTLIWEDAHFLVAVKPIGILSAGAGITRHKTMHELVNEYVKLVSEGKQRAWVVHRLDKEVSGLMIFAKSEESQQIIKENWHTYQKKYLAICENQPKPNHGTLKNYLKEVKQKMMPSDSHVNGAVLAISHYSVLHPIGERSLVEVTLETGKKNQIRAQLGIAGCPIVGDWKYGADPENKVDVRLFSYELSIVHPLTQQTLKWKVDPPKSFFQV